MKKRMTLTERRPLHALRAVCAAAAALAVSACTHDPAGEPERDGDLAVRLNLIIPGGNNPATRAIGGTEENTVRTVDVLAFEVSGGAEVFGYSATGTLVSGQGTGTQTFSAPLQTSAALQRLVVITNARTEVSTLLASSSWKGAEKNSMLAQLRVNLSGDRWNAASSASYTALPMWGESATQVITSQTQTLTAPLSLMRMTARVDVQLDASVAGLTDKFKLRSVALYNTNTGGRVVPAPATVAAKSYNGNNNYLYVTATSIPTDLQPYSARSKGPISYTDFTSPGAADVAMRGAIYTFEADAASDDAQAACLVVGGLYGTDTTPSYYRVNFYDGDPDKPKNTPLALLRNYLYTIDITDVKQRGHATPDEAFASRAINMNVNILQWNDAEMNSVVYDGDVWLVVDHNNISLYKNAYQTALAGGDNVFTVDTNAAGGWSIDRIVDAADGATPATWLSISPSTGAANTKTDAAVIATQNAAANDRSALVWIKAGTITFSVKVTQSGSQAMPTMLALSDVNSKEITELAFTSAADVAPAAQELHVDWTPPNFSLNVATATETNATTGFPTGSGQPANGEVIPAGSGHKVYTIAPPAITSAEYSANPFILKSTKVDVSLNNGVTTTTKTVYLRQMIPNIQTTTSAYYLINGSSYSFSVRSNSNWVIKSVTEKQNQSYADRANTAMLNNKSTDNLRVGYVGSPNTSTAGTSVTFTTSSQIGKWGTIDVVIGSPDSPAKFADRTVTLVLAAPQIRIYGFGFATSGEGGGVYNMIDTSQKSGTMIATTRNFGTTATSTVITPTPSTIGWNVNGTNGTNYTVTTTDIQRAIDFGADVLTLSGNVQWGDDVSVMIKRQFLDNGKPVWINIQHVDTMTSMINTIFGKAWIDSVPVLYYINYESAQGATYAVMNNSDPVLVGPFGDVRGKYWGEHWTGSHGLFDLPTNVCTRVSNFINQSGTTSSSGSDNTRQYNCFRLKQVPLFWAADDGFTRSDTPNGTNISPFYLDANNVPAPKTYGGAAPQQQIYNSHIVANFIAWCVARNPAK